MIIIILAALTGVLFSGLLGSAIHNRFVFLGRSFPYTISALILIIIVGVPVIKSLLGMFSATKYYFYIVGILPVLAGFYLFGMLGYSRFNNSGTKAFTNFLISMLGNIFLFIVFAHYYNISVIILFYLLFLFFVLTISIIFVVRKYYSTQILHKNLNEILELAEMFNGIYLVIAGLVVFSNQIYVLESVIENFIQ